MFFSLLGQRLLPSESLVWGWGFPQNWSQGHELSPGQGPTDLDFPEARGFGVHFRQPSCLEIFGVIDSKSLLVSGPKAHRSPAGHCDGVDTPATQESLPQTCNTPSPLAPFCLHVGHVSYHQTKNIVKSMLCFAVRDPVCPVRETACPRAYLLMTPHQAP